MPRSTLQPGNVLINTLATTLLFRLLNFVILIKRSVFGQPQYFFYEIGSRSSQDIIFIL